MNIEQSNNSEKKKVLLNHLLLKQTLGIKPKVTNDEFLILKESQEDIAKLKDLQVDLDVHGIYWHKRNLFARSLNILMLFNLTVYSIEYLDHESKALAE